ncbi:hypothetical protein AB0B07_07895 [Streptomyces sioyaensis]|uniref:hypothetical protein n=1 Tax=Streptomyces sioyaensis TaxID=67364 RepID=UPI0033D05120
MPPLSAGLDQVSSLLIRSLLRREQAGGGLNDVTHVLAVTEVAGQCPAVLQVGDAVQNLI